jgi:hypothetical protein
MAVSDMPFGNSLLGRVLDELDTLGDVALETSVACLEELLLVVVGAADYINGLLSTTGLDGTSVCDQNQDRVSSYAKLDGNGEEVCSSDLRNGFTARHTGKVDKAGLDDALLALKGLDDLLGETVSG